MQTPSYSYRPRTPTDTLPGWICKPTKQYVIVEPDGSLADWPLLDTEEEARRDCMEFNRDLREEDPAISEALWQRRMAGDLEG